MPEHLYYFKAHEDLRGQTLEQTWLQSITPHPLGCGVEDRTKTDSKIVMVHNKMLIHNTLILQMYY